MWFSSVLLVIKVCRLPRPYLNKNLAPEKGLAQRMQVNVANGLERSAIVGLRALFSRSPNGRCWKRTGDNGTNCDAFLLACWTVRTAERCSRAHDWLLAVSVLPFAIFGVIVAVCCKCSTSFFCCDKTHIVLFVQAIIFMWFRPMSKLASLTTWAHSIFWASFFTQHRPLLGWILPSYCVGLFQSLRQW